jgi:hypothetical protein
LLNHSTIFDVKPGVVVSNASKQDSLKFCDFSLARNRLIPVPRHAYTVGIGQYVSKFLRISLTVTKHNRWLLTREPRQNLGDVPIQCTPEPKLLITVLSNESLSNNMYRERNRAIRCVKGV